MNESRARRTQTDKPLGFWACWALTVGVMIGSGVFLLPAVLAPYGIAAFGGWVITGAGSILLALTLARLAARTSETGGPYVYARDAFGNLTGFLVMWGYWASYWIGIPAVAIAFAGYLAVFVPALSQAPAMQCAAALALIWTFTLVAIRGARESGLTQLVMTALKLVPLAAIIGVGLLRGEPGNLPAFNPSGAALPSVLAATALLTMWAFTGLECGVIPAGDVRDPQRTMPRAVVAGTVTVTIIYLAASAAVMLLVPPETLRSSSAPFAEAAKALGSWGPALIGAGALAATAGTMNGLVFIAGQLPMAVARDQLAPRLFARLNRSGAPHASILISSALSSVLLLTNYTRGLIGAFTFLVMMSTITVLAPLLISTAAEVKHSWRTAPVWALVALGGSAYSVFAILGSGLETIAWGVVLTAAGLPAYLLGRRPKTLLR